MVYYFISILYFSLFNLYLLFFEAPHENYRCVTGASSQNILFIIYNITNLIYERFYSSVLNAVNTWQNRVRSTQVRKRKIGGMCSLIFCIIYSVASVVITDFNVVA